MPCVQADVSTSLTYDRYNPVLSEDKIRKADPSSFLVLESYDSLAAWQPDRLSKLQPHLHPLATSKPAMRLRFVAEPSSIEYGASMKVTSYGCAVLVLYHKVECPDLVFLFDCRVS